MPTQGVGDRSFGRRFNVMPRIAFHFGLALSDDVPTGPGTPPLDGPARIADTISQVLEMDARIADKRLVGRMDQDPGDTGIGQGPLS